MESPKQKTVFAEIKESQRVDHFCLRPIDFFSDPVVWLLLEHGNPKSDQSVKRLVLWTQEHSRALGTPVAICIFFLYSIYLIWDPELVLLKHAIPGLWRGCTPDMDYKQLAVP